MSGRKACYSSIKQRRALEMEDRVGWRFLMLSFREHSGGLPQGRLSAMKGPCTHILFIYNATLMYLYRFTANTTDPPRNACAGPDTLIRHVLPGTVEV